MKRESLSVEEEIERLAKAGKSTRSVLREALRPYKEAHPEAKLEIAIDLYQTDKISLARAAELA